MPRSRGIKRYSNYSREPLFNLEDGSPWSEIKVTSYTDYVSFSTLIDSEVFLDNTGLKALAKEMTKKMVEDMMKGWGLGQDIFTSQYEEIV